MKMFFALFWLTTLLSCGDEYAICTDSDLQPECEVADLYVGSSPSAVWPVSFYDADLGVWFYNWRPLDEEDGCTIQTCPRLSWRIEQDWYKGAYVFFTKDLQSMGELVQNGHDVPFRTTLFDRTQRFVQQDAQLGDGMHYFNFVPYGDEVSSALLRIIPVYLDSTYWSVSYCRKDRVYRLRSGRG